MQLSTVDVERAADVIALADALLVQLEVPLEAVAAAIAIAKSRGVLTVLDPAPAPAGPLPPELFAVDVLSPNQTEAEALTGIAVASPADAARAAAALHALGARLVAIKLGEQGALASDGQGHVTHLSAPQVEAIDTTAAGDAFTAALAVALVAGRPLAEATRMACAAGSLATTRRGAQDAMPTRHEVDRRFTA
jgi:ribokinase